jgi:hypothetical protein
MVHARRVGIAHCAEEGLHKPYPDWLFHILGAWASAAVAVVVEELLRVRHQAVDHLAREGNLLDLASGECSEQGVDAVAVGPVKCAHRPRQGAAEREHAPIPWAGAVPRSPVSR